jgi:hypothetical protein
MAAIIVQHQEGNANASGMQECLNKKWQEELDITACRLLSQGPELLGQGSNLLVW